MEQLLSLRGFFTLSLAGLGAALTFKKAKYGIIIFIILLLLRAPFLASWFPPIYSVLHLPKVFGILTLISWLLQKNKYPLRLPIQFWLMVSFLGVICLSRFLAHSEVFGNKVTSEFFKMCVLFLLIVNVVKDEKDVKQIIWTLLGITFVVTLYHYHYYKTSWRSIFVLPVYRGLDRNEFAATLVAMIPLAYIFFKKEGHILKRVFSGLCFLSFVGGVILTRSRAGALALGVTLFVSILQDTKRVKSAFFILILGLIIGSRISERYIDRIKSIVHYREDTSAMIRIATNRAAINMVKTYPIFGIGAGNFGNLVLNYTPESLKQYVETGINIHNIFLQVASETGLIGLLVFITLIMKSFIDVIRLRKYKLEPIGYMATGLGISLFGYCLAGQFIPGAYYKYQYIFFPLITAISQIAHEKLAKYMDAHLYH
ncbi:MAG: hypothetical protein DRO89_02250 [Candidatus Altiarchaeales archaeon]|nr:MAG: hypothetical protein DRO89_02250 [Candidatus Altiarchaeales archaeon]